MQHAFAWPENYSASDAKTVSVIKMWNIDFDQKPHGAADCGHVAKLPGNVRLWDKADIPTRWSFAIPGEILHRNMRRSALKARGLVPKVSTVDCGYFGQNNSLS